MRILLGIALALFAVALPEEHARAAKLMFDTEPEVTFEIPQGWVACDAATGAVLQGPVPAGRMAALCAAFDDTGGARMVGSPDGSLVLTFSINGPTVFPPEFFRAATAEKVSAQSAALCRATFKVSTGGPPCTFQLQNVAGRPALVGRIQTPDGKFDVGRMVVVSGKSRSATFAFLTTAPGPDSGNRIDGILASIRVPGKPEQH